MNLEAAKDVMFATHKAALMLGVRASAIELESGPGVGKSSAVWQLCQRMSAELNVNVGLVTRMLATLQSVDLQGFMIPLPRPPGRPLTYFSVPPWMPTDQTCTVFTPAGEVIRPPLPQDMPIPEIGILFLDEYGQAEIEIQKASAPLILSGEIGADRLPEPGWRVIMASNRMKDRSGVQRRLAFLTNRRMLLPVSATYSCFEDYCNGLPEQHRPHHMVMSFANTNTGIVFREEVPPGDDPFCTPRSLLAMDRDLRSLRTKEDVTQDALPTDMIAREVIAGHIGPGEGAQFMTHLKYHGELAAIEDIVRDPAGAKLGAREDVQLVTAFMLSHHVSARNCKSILQYMRRMEVELQVVTMRQINNTAEKASVVMNTKEAVDWLLKYRDLLVASHA